MEPTKAEERWERGSTSGKTNQQGEVPDYFFFGGNRARDLWQAEMVRILDLQGTHQGVKFREAS
jgi:hypothetical protein